MLTKLYLRDFLRRGEGMILNVSSSAAFLPGPLLSSYYASKDVYKRQLLYSIRLAFVNTFRLYFF